MFVVASPPAMSDNQRRHFLVARLRHGKGRQHEGTAHFLDLEHRAETGQHLVGQQGFQARQQFSLADAELCGRFGVRSLADGEIALQGGQNPAVDVGQLRHSALRSA